MEGLEVLYTYLGSSITCPEDAVACFIHWEIIKSGYRCIGCGDEPRSSDKKSELLPADWSSSKELYSLRYKTKDGDDELLLKAIPVDSVLIFNLMECRTQQVFDLMVKISDHVDAEQLKNFDSVFKKTDSLSKTVRAQLLPPPDRISEMGTQTEEDEGQWSEEGCNQIQFPTLRPIGGFMPGPMHMFAAGGPDLEASGSHGSGSMIVGPMRPGFHMSGFPQMQWYPRRPPPWRLLEPFEQVGEHRPGPDRDHELLPAEDV